GDLGRERPVIEDGVGRQVVDNRSICADGQTTVNAYLRGYLSQRAWRARRDHHEWNTPPHQRRDERPGPPGGRAIAPKECAIEVGCYKLDRRLGERGGKYRHIILASGVAGGFAHSALIIAC